MKDDAIKHEPQIIGNIGMFYACYRLSCLGWNVMPTSRNARGVIAYSPNATLFRENIGPVPRDSHALTFDSTRGAVVLFGGSGTNSAILGDTWEHNT